MEERAPSSSAELEISEHLIDSFLYLCGLSDECFYELDNSSLSKHSMDTTKLAILFPDPFSSYEKTDIKLRVGVVPGSASDAQF